MRRDAPRPVSRRGFLGLLASTVAWILTGCGRRDRGTSAANSYQPTISRPSATASPTALPSALPSPTLGPRLTFTPVPEPTPITLEGEADLALINGKVITVDAGDTIAQSVTIKNGLIQTVGSTDAIRTRVGTGTQVIDLKGRTLTPGLIDAHNHFQLVALFGTYFQPFLPPEVKSIAELKARLADIASRTPKGQWIVGYYLVFSEGRVPNRHDLDPVTPDHPAWIMQQGGHLGASNSLGLQLAGISSKTANPVGGIIERDAAGEPTGVFYNHRAMDLLRKAIPVWTAEQTRENIIGTQSIFAECGVTTFHDNNVRGTEAIKVYLDVGKQNKMYLRSSVYYTLEWPNDLNRALKEMEHYADPYMRFAGFKFLIDGQAPTAFCHEPHNGTSWNISTWEPNSFKRTVRELHDTGLQICVHCAGDAAADLALDAFEEAMNANPRPDPRHRLEHAVLTTADATKRIRDLGVVISTQPQFLRVAGDAWVRYLGEERAHRFVVTREWLDNGVHLALGSDAPTTPWYCPQITLWGALARISYSGKVMGPEQCLTIQEALRAHTMGSAYAGHEDKTKGSIEIGKLADMIVWHEDLYTVPVQRIPQITIDMTIVGGRTVYQA